MEEKNGRKPEDLATELDSFEVSELDDKDLEQVAGGSIAPPTNTNCGCPPPFSGVDGSNNNNCGCTGKGTAE